VRTGKRPPSENFLRALTELYYSTHQGELEQEAMEALNRFIASRADGTSQGTIDFYSKYLTKSVPVLGLSPSPKALEKYLTTLTCTLGGKHAYFRAISVFYNWLYSARSGYNLSPRDNPIDLIDPPKKPNLILPSLTREQVDLLISTAKTTRDKAIISLFVESGLRLSELVNLTRSDTNGSSA